MEKKSLKEEFEIDWVGKGGGKLTGKEGWDGKGEGRGAGGKGPKRGGKRKERDNP